MIRSSFFGFVTAQRAMSASQKALDVVGQNISNTNTEGYTRQRLDLYSAPSGGYSDRYSSQNAVNVGSGVEMEGVNQIRDPFLDVRFREENPRVAELDSLLYGLEELETIFDETTTTGLDSHIMDFVSQLNQLSMNAGEQEFDHIVKSSAESLIKLFNQFANQVDQVNAQQAFEFTDVSIPRVNELLTNIAALNKSIRNDQLHGNNSLELNDQRNMLIDELSTYINIETQVVEKKLAEGVWVSELQINLVDSHAIPPTKQPLIYNDEAVQFTAGTDVDGNHTVTMNGTLSDLAITYTDEDITTDLSVGALKGTLDFLNGAGEFGAAGDPRGLPYYREMLDKMAFEFADMMNTANQIYVVDPADPTLTVLEDRPLFESSIAGEEISASNIKISEGWANFDYGITALKDPTSKPVDGDVTGDNSNILYMIDLFTQNHDFHLVNGDDTSPVMFNGTFQEFLGNMKNTLALDISSNEKIFENYATVLMGIDSQRSGLSSVSLDEEGINLLKFQKSYNAAARFMTTLDEALDVVINQMGIVGR